MNTLVKIALRLLPALGQRYSLLHHVSVDEDAKERQWQCEAVESLHPQSVGSGEADGNQDADAGWLISFNGLERLSF